MWVVEVVVVLQMEVVGVEAVEQVASVQVRDYLLHQELRIQLRLPQEVLETQLALTLPFRQSHLMVVARAEHHQVRELMAALEAVVVLPLLVAQEILPQHLLMVAMAHLLPLVKAIMAVRVLAHLGFQLEVVVVLEPQDRPLLRQAVATGAMELHRQFLAPQRLMLAAAVEAVTL